MNQLTLFELPTPPGPNMSAIHPDIEEQKRRAAGQPELNPPAGNCRACKKRTDGGLLFEGVCVDCRLLSEKKEGPPKRPPSPTYVNPHPKNEYKEDTTIATKRKRNPARLGKGRKSAQPAMKVKTLRADSGRHRYLVLYGGTPILLGRAEFPTVGDAKSAGKAKARELQLDRTEIAFMPYHVALSGHCHECMRAGHLRQAVKLDNAGTASVLCRGCWEERHPHHLQRTGVA